MKSLFRGSEGRWLVALAIVALVVRLGWAWAMMDRAPQFDEVDYIELAARLAAGEGYVDATGAQAAYWPVGYPALLSLVFRLLGGPSTVAAVGLQIVLGVATCLLLSLVGSRAIGQRAGRLAGLLLALYPTHVMYSTLRLTEPLFMLLLLGAISCLSLEMGRKRVGQVAAGLLLGLAVLTRPMIVLFIFVLPLGLLGQERRWRRALPAALVVIATTLVTIGPWLVRNHEVTGRWTTLTTSGGFNFWVGNNPAAKGGYVLPEGLKAPLWNGEEFDWHRGYGLGLEAIREDPAIALWRLPLKISHLVALETDGVFWNLKGLESRPPLPVVLALLAVASATYLLVLATAPLALLSRRDRTSFAKFTVLLCVYMLMIVTVFFGDPRFHLPLMPFLMLSTASLLADEDGWRWTSPGEVLSESRSRTVLWIGTLLAAGLLMVINLAVKHAQGAW